MKNKLKTHRAAAKRYTLTKSGTYKRRKAFKSHLLSSKTTKRKRHLRKGTVVHHTSLKAVRRQMPFAGK